MQSNTRTIIKSAFEMDKTVSPDIVQAVFAVLDGETVVGVVSRKPIDRVLSRKQVAAIIGVSEKMVDVYGRRGVIRRVKLLGKQAQGYSEESVRAAIEGRSVRMH